MDRVENIETRIDRLNSVVKELKQYETDRPNGNDDPADKALAITKTQLSFYEGIYEKEGIVTTYHGSMLYHDPVNLDVDVTFFTEQEMAHDTFLKFVPMQHLMEKNKNWPLTGECVTNFGFYSIEEIRKRAQEYNNGESYKEDGDYSFMYASEILTSRALFPEHEKGLEKLRTEVIEILKGCPTLLDLVIDDVQDCINNRKERRAILKGTKSSSDS